MKILDVFFQKHNEVNHATVDNDVDYWTSLRELHGISKNKWTIWYVLMVVPQKPQKDKFYNNYV